VKSIAHSDANVSVGFDPNYFAQLAKLEPYNFWFRARNKLITWAFSRYCYPVDNFLEIGCGTGFVLSAMSKSFPLLKLFGSELYAEGLAFAQQRVPQATLLQLDATAMPHESEFDVIGAFDVLEHIEDDVEVLCQIKKALRSGGTLIMTVPQHQFLWSRSDEFAHHFRRYEAGDLINKLRQAGFCKIRQTSFYSSLLPLMLASRIWQHFSPKEYNVMSELKITSGIVGFFLERILDLELLMIRLGISFPFGGTLLVVAKAI
jgi:SAM-dependent methyltransferase